MTTKVTIAVPGTEQRSIRVVIMQTDAVDSVQEIHPGQSAEMWVYAQQELHIQEIDPDAKTDEPAAPDAPLLPPGTEIKPVGTIGTATEIIPGAIQVPPADLSVPLVDSAVRVNGDGSEFIEPVSMAADLSPEAVAFLDSRESGVETKTYADGSTATGKGPLPDQSPAEQDAAVLSTE